MSPAFTAIPRTCCQRAELNSVNVQLFLASNPPQVKVWLISAGFAAFSREKPTRSFECVTCSYKNGKLTQLQSGVLPLSTCRCLQCIRTGYVSVGRCPMKVVWPLFPSSADAPLAPWELPDGSAPCCAFSRRHPRAWLALLVYFVVGLEAGPRYIGSYLLLFYFLKLNLK